MRLGAGDYNGDGLDDLAAMYGYSDGKVTRYEKTATIYLAGLHIAGIFLWSAR
ncbi:hypothetical protein [Streptomyces sp. SCL15-6]|uniref:hypothetical protein n=1 Tax=Streptomyces sp. SCL15-6 TaxID=2967222 RepID=UPI002966241E|nr:hypothetical protein [Streptomyces sp. SCL15-6]